MGIIRVEHQVTGLCVRPRNIGAIAVLHGGSTAVADDIAAARLIEEMLSGTRAVPAPITEQVKQVQALYQAMQTSDAASRAALQAFNRSAE